MMLRQAPVSTILYEVPTKFPSVVDFGPMHRELGNKKERKKQGAETDLQSYVVAKLQLFVLS